MELSSLPLGAVLESCSGLVWSPPLLCCFCPTSGALQEKKTQSTAHVVTSVKYEQHSQPYHWPLFL